MNINLEILEKSYNLTLNETKDKIWVYPLNELDIIHYVLPPNLEECVLITLDEFLDFNFHLIKFTDDTYSATELKNSEPTEEEWIHYDEISKIRYKKYTDYIGVETEVPYVN